MAAMTLEVLPTRRRADAESVEAPEVSVVAPMYNEETNVAPFVAAVSEVPDGAGVRYEIVLVDDGSRDGTWRAMQIAAETRKHVRGLSLSRNFGHQGALFAGLYHARGRALVTMGGGLQHPPPVVLGLVAAWPDG